MIDEPHAFEDDIVVKEAFEGGEVIYSAYANGQLIIRYPPRRAGNAMVARQLAGPALTEARLKKDLLDIVTWFSATHRGHECEIVIYRYLYQRRHKAISHLLVFSDPENRSQITAIVVEAFKSFGWTIDPKGTSSVEWFEDPTCLKCRRIADYRRWVG